jgi:hypothetical protein
MAWLLAVTLTPRVYLRRGGSCSRSAADSVTCHTCILPHGILRFGSHSLCEAPGHDGPVPRRPLVGTYHPVAAVDEAVYGTSANQLAADPLGGEASRAEEEHRECGSTSRSDSRFGCLIPRPG